MGMSRTYRRKRKGWEIFDEAERKRLSNRGRRDLNMLGEVIESV